MTALLALACGCAGVVSEPPEPLKVLMIGNSFSQSVLWETPAFAKSAGVTLDLAQCYIGGCSLKTHWTNVEKGQADPAFAPYEILWNYATAAVPTNPPLAKLGRKSNLRQMLVADRWDVVTIQQCCRNSFLPETYQPYADNLIATIRRLAPQARIFFHETWSNAAYHPRFVEYRMTPAEMTAKVRKASVALAKGRGLGVIPTGDAVELFRARLPVDYGKLPTQAEISAMKRPAILDFHGDVVGRSEWRQGDKGFDADWVTVRLYNDLGHLNRRGYYLQAAVWTAALFDIDPTKVTYRPGFLTEAEARLMRECARDAVAGLESDK